MSEEPDYLALSQMNERHEPTVCAIHLAPINRGPVQVGDVVRCHADCGMGEPFDGPILVVYDGVLDGWYEMGGDPKYPEMRVHRQELELLSAAQAQGRKAK